jgi:hypothetical protein
MLGSVSGTEVGVLGASVGVTSGVSVVGVVVGSTAVFGATVL